MEFVKCQFLCTAACRYFSFQDVVLQWLMTDNIQLNQIDAEDPEVRKYTWHDHIVIYIVCYVIWYPSCLGLELDIYFIIN